MNIRKEPRFGALMIDVTRLMRAEFNRRLQPLGLTQAQWRALAKLSRDGNLRQNQLAEELEIKPMTVTRLVDRLEELELVERRTDPADRRAQRLHLTEKAIPIIDELWRQADSLTEEILEGVSASERLATVQVLERIKVNLNAPSTLSGGVSQGPAGGQDS